jgi:MEMO1 family protein
VSGMQCSFVPHPPIILEEIGGEHTREAANTCDAMKRLAGEMAQLDPGTVVISSPHAKGGIGSVGVYAEPALAGSFAEFGYPQLKYAFKNDLDLVAEVLGQGGGFFEPVPTPKLDHGELVFLDYLQKAGCTPRLVVLSAVWGSPKSYYDAGKALGAVLRKHTGGVQYVASGDLSHSTRNTPGRRATPEGPQFDRIVAAAVKGADPKPLLALDEGFIRNAQQCGLCSFLLGFGVMDGEDAKGEVYSYDDPFGVGYLVGKIAGGK